MYIAALLFVSAVFLAKKSVSEVSLLLMMAEVRITAMAMLWLQSLIRRSFLMGSSSICSAAVATAPSLAMLIRVMTMERARTTVKPSASRCPIFMFDNKFMWK